MSSKRPLSSIDPDIPTKVGRIRAKKLKHNARIDFLVRLKYGDTPSRGHYHSRTMEFEEHQKFRCFFMINSRYLDSVFMNSNVTVYFSFDHIRINVRFEYNRLHNDFYVETSTLALIQVAKIQKIKINLNSESFDVEKIKVKRWIQTCLLLKNHTTLDNIELNMQYKNHIYQRIFFDLLYKKIKEICISSCPNIVYFDSKLKLDKLEVCEKFTEISGLLRTNTRQIVFSNYDGDMLLKFFNGGKLAPNSNIKFMKLNVNFGCFENDKFQVKIGSKLHPWKEFMFPKYTRAIESLKCMNPDIKLEIFNFKSPARENNIDDFNCAILFMKQLIENIQLFIRLFQSNEMSINSIKINSYVYVKQRDKDFVENIAKEFQMKYERMMIKDTILYNGIEVTFKIYFWGCS